jgi:hypothetical protein
MNVKVEVEETFPNVETEGFWARAFTEDMDSFVIPVDAKVRAGDELIISVFPASQESVKVSKRELNEAFELLCSLNKYLDCCDNCRHDNLCIESGYKAEHCDACSNRNTSDCPETPQKEYDENAGIGE